MDEDSASMKEFFVEPQKGFWLRKRKRRNSDAVSVCSFDTSLTSEPENKRKRGLSKVASLANLLSTPIRPVMKIGVSLQRSFTGSKTESPSTSSPITSSPRNFLRRSCSILKTPASHSQQIVTPPCAKLRLTRSWSQAIAQNITKELGLKEVKRQEAIYELWSGEDGMVEDLEFVQSMYQNALQLHLLTEEEARCIFGEMDDLVVVHRSLRDNLAELRDSVGITEVVGKTLLNWIPTLKCYIGYCSNQVWARALINEKKNSNKRFQGYLKQCLESSCSRKLDLWTFLDVPRSRLMKYPLLIGEILRHTPSNHKDTVPLSQTVSALNLVLQQADIATGAAEYRLMRTRLHFPRDHPSIHLVDKSSAVICSGELRDNHGSKFHCCLFNTCFVVTRTCRPAVKFNVCFPVIPAEQLNVEELELTRRSTGTQTTRAGRPAFQVGFKDTSLGSNRIFITADEHVRKHWMDCIRKVTHSVIAQDNTKVSEAARKKKSAVSCRRMNNIPCKESDSHFVRPFSKRSRISKSTVNDNLV